MSVDWRGGSTALVLLEHRPERPRAAPLTIAICVVRPKKSSVGFLDAALDRTIFLSYDRSGFRRHARAFRPADLDVSLAGKVCLVTGASSGLGVEITRGLFARGATVHMLCRDRAKGEAVKASLGTGPGSLVVDPIDVADFDSIRRFASARGDQRVDVLVHNAGVLPAARAKAPGAGLELTVATNLVGPFLLTHLLWPALLRSDDPRLVHVSSGGMYAERLDVRALFEPPEPFDGVSAYARTKRAQVVLSEMLAARAPRVRVSSMHPGWADTPGVETSLPRFYRLMKGRLRTAAEGADTVVWLAAAEAARDARGRFYFDRAPQETYLRRSTREAPEERARLWSALCGHVGAEPVRAFRDEPG